MIDGDGGARRKKIELVLPSICASSKLGAKVERRGRMKEANESHGPSEVGMR